MTALRVAGGVAGSRLPEGSRSTETALEKMTGLSGI